MHPCPPPPPNKGGVEAEEDRGRLTGVLKCVPPSLEGTAGRCLTRERLVAAPSARACGAAQDLRGVWAAGPWQTP